MAISEKGIKDDLEEAPPLLLDEAARPRRVALFVEPSPFAYASALSLSPFSFVFPFYFSCLGSSGSVFPLCAFLAWSMGLF
jgi:hypothetical protein